jgi:hypothetical protein
MQDGTRKTFYRLNELQQDETIWKTNPVRQTRTAVKTNATTVDRRDSGAVNKLF